MSLNEARDKLLDMAKDWERLAAEREAMLQDEAPIGITMSDTRSEVVEPVTPLARTQRLQEA
jgi:hypothetical protein